MALVRWLLLALAFTSTAFAQPPAVTLSVDKQPLTEVVKTLAQQTGFQFVVVAGAGERTVTLTAEQAPLPDVFRRLRSLTGCAFVRSRKVMVAARREGRWSLPSRSRFSNSPVESKGTTK